MTPLTIEAAPAVPIIARHLTPVDSSLGDWGPLAAVMAASRFVLLGEASHGTREFYRARIEMTRRLITHHGFHAVALEADWPTAYRVNCYVRGQSDDADADQALSDFQAFPTWMWRNREMLDFVNWLRAYNDALPAGAPRVGVYGLDLYSLHASLQAVLRHLDEVDPEAAERARERYACFDAHDSTRQEYGFAAAMGLQESCQEGAVQQLLEMQQRHARAMAQDGRLLEDREFYAEQNARLVKNAEAYYREMYRGGANTWNLRDTHMADTLDALALHLSRGGRPARIAVWAHNSHLGDASAKEMGRGGEINLGQLMRQRHRGRVFALGFTTHRGSVTAAYRWGDPPHFKQVLPALPGSVEELFHEAGEGADFLLLPYEDRELELSLMPERLQRAIGVIYRPDTERMSHYFHASLARQFHGVVHFDRTSAVEPLEWGAHWRPPAEDAPETFPSGL